MAYGNWTPSLSVNVSVIDAQHRELLGLINQLHDAMTRGEGHKVLGRIIEGLVDYTRIHFTTEEAYFEASNYSDCVAHKLQHREFVAKVTDFRQGFDEGRLMMTLDVMDFLGDWLVEHIRGTDTSYAPYLQQERMA